jgi:hypothetical protein
VPADLHVGLVEIRRLLDEGKRVGNPAAVAIDRLAVHESVEERAEVDGFDDYIAIDLALDLGAREAW